MCPHLTFMQCRLHQLLILKKFLHINLQIFQHDQCNFKFFFFLLHSNPNMTPVLCILFHLYILFNYILTLTGVFHNMLKASILVVVGASLHTILSQAISKNKRSRLVKMSSIQHIDLLLGVIWPTSSATRIKNTSTKNN